MTHSMTIKQIIEKAVSTQQTHAQALGADELLSWFAPILEQSVSEFCLDSRQATKDCAFVLLKSSSQDKQTASKRACEYIEAVKDKASVIISEFDAADLALSESQVPMVFVPKIRTVLGDLIAASLQLQSAVTLPKVIAVTGTNGKTTVSQLIAQLCQASGISAAIMGTAGNGKLGQLVQSANTTGDVLLVQKFLYQMGQAGVQVVALEASSHGLDQYRLQGVPVAVAVYTNLSHDHLDYHANMEEYRLAKARLFNPALFPTLQAGVVNADAQYALLDDEVDYPVYRYSWQQGDYVATSVEPSLDGVRIELQSPHGSMTLQSPLLGLFNVDNLLASVAAFASLYPQQVCHIPKMVQTLEGARGRMQRANSQTGSFIVDYAHTPDALVQVLSSLRKHCTGKLIAVFGCGGDRDKTKRPLMTRAGLDYADQVILTADNPRSEEPSAILSDMQQGLSCEDHYKILIEADRKKAIELAVSSAKASDIVVIAGKGHETYQEIKGVRHDFDDLAILNYLLKKYQK